MAQTPRPFATCSLTHSGDTHSVHVSFSSAEDTDPATNPRAECLTYPDRAPILAIDQGIVHAQITAAADPPTPADLDAARSLAMAAVKYFETTHRLLHGQPPHPRGDGNGLRLPNEAT